MRFVLIKPVEEYVIYFDIPIYGYVYLSCNHVKFISTGLSILECDWEVTLNECELSWSIFLLTFVSIDSIQDK